MIESQFNSESLREAKTSRKFLCSICQESGFYNSNYPSVELLPIAGTPSSWPLGLIQAKYHQHRQDAPSVTRKQAIFIRDYQLMIRNRGLFLSHFALLNS